jgi:hypothetical protein
LPQLLSTSSQPLLLLVIVVAITMTNAAVVTLAFSVAAYCPAVYVADAIALNTVIIVIAIINNALALAFRLCLGHCYSHSHRHCCHHSR